MADEDQIDTNQADEARQTVQAAQAEASRQLGRRLTQLARRAVLNAVKANPMVVAVGLAIIGGLLLIALLFFAIGLSGGDAAADGTGPLVPFDRSSATDLAALKTALSGGVDSAAKANQVLQETAKKKSSLIDNAEALAALEAIEAAALAIVKADPSDKTIIQKQKKIITQKFRELQSLVASNVCGDIAPCLDVEGIAESVRTHCGRVSALMVLLYINQGEGATYFNPDRYIKTVDGRKEDRAEVESCLFDPTMDRLSPPNRRGWRHVSWTDMSGGSSAENKEKVLTTIKNSLNGGDPVILFLEPGGIFNDSKHIMVVVGHDADDEPSKGGTFLINNPNIHSVTVKTKFGSTQDKKLTGDWLKQYMGGDGNPYETSIVVRQEYLND